MASTALPNFSALKDHPALRQLALLVGVALAVSLGLWGYRWSQQPGYVPLYSGLTDRDAADTADALRSSNIPFRYEPTSGVIAVPDAQLNDARLKLAAEGLPRGSGIGFEMMQEDQGFGTSQFIENARYQHALETELSRTVSSLQPVRAARVHLAIPKPSAFSRNNNQPSASVLVDLHAGRSLEQNQVESIIHMVASSVPGMVPSAVTVIDQFGRLLSNLESDSALARSAEQLDYARRVESDYVRRVKELLLPLVGPERVSAQVAADIDFSVTEEARESYQPDPAKIRSEQVVEDTTRGAGAEPVGVPGATSNQPPQASANPELNAVAEDQNVQNQSRQLVRNYELDRTVSHTRQSSGRIERLSVAVLIDHVPRPKPDGKRGEMEMVPLSDAELAKVESLVKEAVGYSEARGDTVTVQNAPFLKTEIPEIDPLPFWQQPQTMDIARQVGGLLLALLLILFVLRPAVRSLLNAPLRAPAAAALPGAGEDVGELRAMPADQVALTGDVTGAAQPQALPVSPYEQKLQLARTAVGQDPKRVAQVVKTWIGQEG
ncbi:MAG: flagellar basal-body MS-ring/collar protein FliF [Nevskiales bacterium]|nr:flagellar basal-body MS-ring/collar protein FliF [Nevskiales bacterium]